jgi:hypothetical protein
MDAHPIRMKSHLTFVSVIFSEDRFRPGSSPEQTFVIMFQSVCEALGRRGRTTRLVSQDLRGQA